MSMQCMNYLISKERGERRCKGALLSCLLVMVNGLVTCGPPPAPVTTNTISSVFVSELRLARESLERSEWSEARRRLRNIVEAVPSSDPVGLEARALLARVEFELGNYPEAVQRADEVPRNSPENHLIDALEVAGMARLFQCNFEEALERFDQLAQLDEARGRTWRGVLFAWIGRDGAAMTEFDAVIQRYGGSPHGALARFYQLQLLLWSGRKLEAQRAYQEIQAEHHGYLQDVSMRARNWIERNVHLMRAYFTFDTLSRTALEQGDLDELTESESAAENALDALRQSSGQCEPQLQRLYEARQEWRQALEEYRAALEAEERARDEAERARLEALRLARLDSDGDGLRDASDSCPQQAETINGIEDSDGCPEETAIFVQGSQIRIADGFAIHFALDSARLLPESQPVLDALRQLLINPAFDYIGQIRIEGHTDRQGEADYNLELSRRRAEAVELALRQAGVPSSKLSHVGYGETRPIAYGQDEEARARNRRVEIYVIDPPIFGGARRF